jgi:hypothetical protein
MGGITERPVKSVGACTILQQVRVGMYDVILSYLSKRKARFTFCDSEVPETITIGKI